MTDHYAGLMLVILTMLLIGIVAYGTRRRVTWSCHICGARLPTRDALIVHEGNHE